MAINIGENQNEQVTYVNSPDINRVLFKNLKDGASKEDIADAVNDWLDEHPEATTTVEDGSILPVKLDSTNSASDGYVLSYNATAGKFEWVDIQSDITDLKESLSENVAESNNGKENLSLYATFVNAGLSSGNLNYSQNYRVAEDTILSFDRDIILTPKTGYRFGIHTFVDGIFDRDSGWQTNPYTIEAGRTFKIVISKVTESTSVVANIPEFVQAVTFSTYVNDTLDTLLAYVPDIERMNNDINDIYGTNIISWNKSLNWDGIGSQEIKYPFKAGEQYDFVLTFSGTTSDSGQKNVQVYDDTNTRIGIYYGDVSSTLTVPNDTEKLRFVVSRTGTWTGWGVAVVISQNARTMLQRIYHVEKDGSGDFTKLTDAIYAAEEYKNSVVYVGDGTWDVLNELGSSYLDAISPTDKTTWGLYLTNGIHLIFSSNSKVIANYTGASENVRKYFSVFNSGVGGFTLENCTIESSNIRYSVHDDPGINTPYKNRYINCTMYHDNSGNTVFGGWQCIGGGFGKSGDIEIIGCAFDGRNQYSNTGGIVSYHNYSEPDSQSRLTIRDCYFYGLFTIRLSWYGTSTKISRLYACGNSLGAAITHRAESESATVENTAVVAWNNEIRAA